MPKSIHWLHHEDYLDPKFDSRWGLTKLEIGSKWTWGLTQCVYSGLNII